MTLKKILKPAATKIDQEKMKREKCCLALLDFRNGLKYNFLPKTDIFSFPYTFFILYPLLETCLAYFLYLNAKIQDGI